MNEISSKQTTNKEINIDIEIKKMYIFLPK